MSSVEAATAANGQPLGKRGQQTRQRILDTIMRIIEDRGIRDLKPVDITRECGLSPAAFYHFFNDLDDALLAICDDVGSHFTRYRNLVADSWGQADSLRHGAYEFVERYAACWDENRSALWTRNVVSQEGDDRFRATRVLTTLPFVNDLMVKIAVGQADGDIDPSLKPIALATALMALAERMNAILPEMVEWLSLDRQDLIDAVGYIFDRTISGCPEHEGYQSVS